MLPYIHYPFEYASSLLGASADELKLITSFLVSYPLAAILKRLPDDKPILKNLFNICIAVFFLVGLFDLWSGLALVAFDATITYLIASLIHGPYMPWIGFVFLMGHMSISHISRQVVASPSTVDITGMQMVMVMKLSAFCWNVFDGRQRGAQLNDVQKDRMLTAMPGIVDYAGFVAFFPSLMAGPAFDYVDYHRWLNTSMFNLPPGADPMTAPPTRKQRRIPQSAIPATMKMAAGLAWVLAFLQMSKFFNAGVVLGPEFMSKGFFLRVLHLHMMSLVERMKYYGVWSLTEGACILSGIGYKGVDPKTGKPDWSRLANIKPWGVELAQNSHAYLGNWNCNTNHWLRNYVYLRVTPQGKKPGFRASLATFATSAFWHGFEPGYYLTFILASFIQNVAKNSRRLLRPFVMTPDGTRPTPYKPYYDAATWLVTQFAFSFTTAPFILLHIDASLQAWAAVYFYTIVGVALCSGFLLTPGRTWLVQHVKARQQSAAPALRRPAAPQSEIVDGVPGAMLGVPGDPGREFDELVDEVVQEVQKGGVGKDFPDGLELRHRIEGKLHGRREDEAREVKKEL